jgi:ABC-type multidrug transport system ATPase subunit
VYAAIKLKNVTKRYGDKIILNNVSIDIPSEKLALTGKNGSGKTTFLKLLARFEAPDSGLIKYSEAIQKLMLASDCIHYPEILTVSNIGYLYTNESVIDLKLFNNFINMFGLDSYRSHTVCDLSTGSLQKLRIAIALSSKHGFLMLDEPLNGLDVNSAMLAMQAIISDDRPMLIVDHESRFNPYLKGELFIESGTCSLKI